MTLSIAKLTQSVAHTVVFTLRQKTFQSHAEENPRACETVECNTFSRKAALINENDRETFLKIQLAVSPFA